ARMYDALHDDPDGVLTCPTDTGNGGFTQRFFRAPTTVEELIASRDAIAAWQRQVYGWLGRSPDYKASFLATLGANAEFYAPYGMPMKKPEFAVMFTVPMNAPGLKLISRASYELQAAATGSPFDYPLSSRFDENDSILVLDQVLVPWENVFAYADADKVNSF